MPVSFKAAQDLTNLTPFFTLKGTAYPLIHVLFTQEHPVTIAQSCSAFPCAVKEKKNQKTKQTCRYNKKISWSLLKASELPCALCRKAH